MAIRMYHPGVNRKCLIAQCLGEAQGQPAGGRDLKKWSASPPQSRRRGGFARSILKEALEPAEPVRRYERWSRRTSGRSKRSNWPIALSPRRHRDGIAKVPRLCSSLDRVSRDCPVVCDRVSFERSKRKLCTCWHLIGRRASHERSVSGSERTADALQRPALGGNREERADQCRGEHQHRAEQVAAENAPA